MYVTGSKFGIAFLMNSLRVCLPPPPSTLEYENQQHYGITRCVVSFIRIYDKPAWYISYRVLHVVYYTLYLIVYEQPAWYHTWYRTWYLASYMVSYVVYHGTVSFVRTKNQHGIIHGIIHGIPYMINNTLSFICAKKTGWYHPWYHTWYIIHGIVSFIPKTNMASYLVHGIVSFIPGTINQHDIMSDKWYRIIHTKKTRYHIIPAGDFCHDGYLSWEGRAGDRRSSRGERCWHGP